MMNKKYADLIIKDSPELFNGIEIQGVREHSGVDDESFVEVDNENPQFYSVYVHLVSGGVDCVGDFSGCNDAIEYANELADKYGWPVYSYCVI
jgi:hypothetical protein